MDNISNIKKQPAWLKRALNPDTPTLENQTVKTRVEWDSKGKKKILFPTIRQVGKNGKLKIFSVDEARTIAEKNKDFIEVDNFEDGNKLSKSISNEISKKRNSIKKKHGGTLLVSKLYKGF